jgi:tRNA dimethylallyltransferase
VIAVLCGPTASGKTSLACALAERLGAEVISADSQQCYRGLDAGTAKPTAEERALAPHHLLDVAWPEEQLDAAAFLGLADRAIAEVEARGKRALVVGGTGLWLRALVRGLLDAPGADPAFRAAFRARVEREGLPPLHAELARVDPDAASAILPGDRVRIERALEVLALGGTRLSQLQREHRFAERRHRARVVLLDPERPLLWERIAARTHALFTAGDEGGHASDRATGDAARAPLISETRTLLERIERVPAAAKALRIIGYGEAAGAIAAGLTSDSLAAAETRVAARTRQYAKRQRTWFAKDAPSLDAGGTPIVLRSVEPGSVDTLSAELAAWYEGSPR